MLKGDAAEQSGRKTTFIILILALRQWPQVTEQYMQQRTSPTQSGFNNTVISNSKQFFLWYLIQQGLLLSDLHNGFTYLVITWPDDPFLTPTILHNTCFFTMGWYTDTNIDTWHQYRWPVGSGLSFCDVWLQIFTLKGSYEKKRLIQTYPTTLHHRVGRFA